MLPVIWPLVAVQQFLSTVIIPTEDDSTSGCWLANFKWKILLCIPYRLRSWGNRNKKDISCVVIYSSMVTWTRMLVTSSWDSSRSGSSRALITSPLLCKYLILWISYFIPARWHGPECPWRHHETIQIRLQSSSDHHWPAGPGYRCSTSVSGHQLWFAF